MPLAESPFFIPRCEWSFGPISIHPEQAIACSVQLPATRKPDEDEVVKVQESFARKSHVIEVPYLIPASPRITRLLSVPCI